VSIVDVSFFLEIQTVDHIIPTDPACAVSVVASRISLLYRIATIITDTDEESRLPSRPHTAQQGRTFDDNFSAFMLMSSEKDIVDSISNEQILLQTHHLD